MTNMPSQFNQKRPLTEDEMARYAPSIFQTEAHESRSLRFQPIPTIEIVRRMAGEGFLPFHAAQSRARDVTKRDFTKHMIRFRKMDRNDLIVGDNILEVVLVNGNDGSSAYKLDAGIFRIACLNGMVVKSKDYGAVKVRHSGDVIGKVIEGTYEVMKGAERALTAPQDWSQIQLDDRMRYAFAVGAHVERFSDAAGNVETAIEPQQLLLPRRREDMGRDLWSTFNVIQENVIRGGLSNSAYNEHGERVRSSMREVMGIDQSVKLNKGLWAMAEYLSEKAAA